MSSAEASARTWIDRGAEAFHFLRNSDAEKCFRLAVERDPESIDARLCLGAMYVFQYQNGLGQPDKGMLERLASRRTPSAEEYRAEAGERRMRNAELNSAYGIKAEEQLMLALDLDAQSIRVVEYLALLCSAWNDEDRQDTRIAEAERWYRRAIELYSEHRFAHYACGRIAFSKSLPLVQAYLGFVRSLLNEREKLSVRTQLSLVLEDGIRDFLRFLEIHPGNGNAMTFLSLLKRNQSLVAETDSQREQANSEADEWHRTAERIQPTRMSWGLTAGIVFQKDPHYQPETKIPVFPPDLQRFVLVMPPPPPPPPPPLSSRLMYKAKM